MPFTTKKPAFLLPEIAFDKGQLPDNLPNDVVALKALLYTQQAAHELAMKSAVDAAVEAAERGVARGGHQRTGAFFVRYGRLTLGRSFTACMNGK